MKVQKSHQRLRNQRKHIPLDMLPIYSIIALLPLIVRLVIKDTNLTNYAWFPNTTQIGDFFLYAKTIVFLFLVICMIALLIDQLVIQQNQLKELKHFYPLAIYLLLTVLSTLLSKHSSFSFHGMIEQFESIWVLAGYCLTAYYCYQIPSQLTHIKSILTSLALSSAILGLLGLFQFIHMDFFETAFGKFLIIPNNLKDYRDATIFNFSSTDFNRVYMTLYNPNYVGVYLCMAIPITTCLALLSKTKKGKVAFSLLTSLLLLNAIGCGSKTALIVLFLLLIIGLFLLGDKVLSYKKYLILTLIGLIATVGLFFLISDNQYFYRLLKSLHFQKETYALTTIVPQQDNVKLMYKEQELYLSSSYTTNQTLTLEITNASGAMLQLKDKPYIDGYYQLEDEIFSEMSFLSYEKNDVKYIAFKYNSLIWRFTDVLGTGYEYITINGKPDEIIIAPAILKDYEKVLTYRGYIWGRTLPLLKDYILIGAGPDQFALVFPQNDYVMRSNMSYGFFTETLSKPHSLYLQIAVQSGVLSLLCVLIFIGAYLLDFIRFYKKRQELGEKELLSIGIFLSITGYLLCAITNDSCIAIAPIFWALLGTGMALQQILRNQNK